MTKESLEVVNCNLGRDLLFARQQAAEALKERDEARGLANDAAPLIVDMEARIIELEKLLAKARELLNQSRAFDYSYGDRNQPDWYGRRDKWLDVCKSVNDEPK